MDSFATLLAYFVIGAAVGYLVVSVTMLAFGLYLWRDDR